MRDLDESQRWLCHAQDEFRDADTLRGMERYYLALFHFQQAAEKALKAYLLSVLGSTEVHRVHSVDSLIRLATEASPDFASVAAAKKLDIYNVPTRYPNGLPGAVPSRFYTDPEEAQQASDLARAVINLVERKMQQGD
ncbi:MAG: HEPN domain-containing protein [Bacillota bacterium]|nr:HEPN domain-containing protein [Bacillota bacterium]